MGEQLAYIFSTSKEENSVFLDENGFINNQYVGYQNSHTVKIVADQTVKFALELKNKNHPVKILVDLKRIKRTNAASRKVASDALKLLLYDRIAMFGANKFLRYVAGLIIAASGLSARVRHFDSKQAAVKWLLEPVPVRGNTS